MSITHAICWTLIHSLWQGLLAALLAGSILLCTPKSSPGLRYRLLTLVFFGLILLVAGTFLWELRREVIPVLTMAHVPVRVVRRIAFETAQVLPLTSTPAHTFTALSLRVSAFFDNNALLIASLWLVVMLVRLTQTGLSLGYIRRIRTRQNRPAPLEWTTRVRSLADGLGLKRPVTLLESALIQIPVVIGYFKPIILLPLGILAQLPQDQLEAVLLHELAHIRRRDYLVNLLQGLVEALLFFNPAIWWISSLIREERENCCDDIAVRATHSKSQLIHALVAFQEYSVSNQAYALAFPGRKNLLLDRVKRIVHNRNKTLNAMEKIFLAGCLVLAGSLTLAFSQLGHHVRPAIVTLTGKDTAPPVPPMPPVAPTDVTPVAPAVAPPVPLMDTLPSVAPIGYDDDLQGGNFEGSLEMDNHTITFARGIWTKGNVTKYFSGDYKIIKTNGILTDLFVGGNKIPQDQLGSYTQIVDKVIRDLEQEREHNKRSDVKRINSNQISGGGTSLSSVDVVGTGAVSVSGQDARATSDAAVTVTGTSDANASANGKGHSYSVDGPATVHLSGRDTKSVNIAYSASSSGQSGSDETTNMNDATDPIFKDLLDMQLISDPKSYSFSLDDKRLIVNDVRQPENVFQKFHTKYILDKRDSYHVIQKDGNTISSVNEHRSN